MGWVVIIASRKDGFVMLVLRDLFHSAAANSTYDLVEKLYLIEGLPFCGIGLESCFIQNRRSCLPGKNPPESLHAGPCMIVCRVADMIEVHQLTIPDAGQHLYHAAVLIEYRQQGFLRHAIEIYLGGKLTATRWPAHDYP